MFCPSMCSGKGVCDWSLSKPACKCFDENDLTDGCYDSGVNEPEECERPSLGIRMVLSPKAVLVSVIAVASLFMA